VILSETVCYLITATHGGESVQDIAAMSKDNSWEPAKRRDAIMAAIGPLALEKFGSDVIPDISWVKSESTKLEYAPDEWVKPFRAPPNHG